MSTTKLDILTEFIQCHKRTMTPTEGDVWLAYWSCADAKTFIAFPSSGLIAEWIGTSDTHVRSARCRLIERGYLGEVERANRTRKAGSYKVLIANGIGTRTESVRERISTDDERNRYASTNGIGTGAPVTPYITESVIESVKEKVKARKRARGSFSVEDVKLPQALQTDAFKTALAEWFKHRREIKKPMTPTASERLIVRLEKLGHDRAIAAIHHSTEQGWLGVYEGKDANRANNKSDFYSEAEAQADATYPGDEKIIASFAEMTSEDIPV